mgnify:CR=1 FL=1
MSKVYNMISKGELYVKDEDSPKAVKIIEGVSHGKIRVEKFHENNRECVWDEQKIRDEGWDRVTDKFNEEELERIIKQENKT